MTHCLPPFHLTPIYLPLVIKCELSNRQGNEGKTGENGDQKSPKTARILREDVSSVQGPTMAVIEAPVNPDLV